jgi:hypothetical protein
VFVHKTHPFDARHTVLFRKKNLITDYSSKHLKDWILGKNLSSGGLEK